MNTINKGSIFAVKNNYLIYEINDNNLKYYITIPNEDTYTLTFYVGLTPNDYSKLDNTLKEKEIDEVASKIYKLNPNSIYLLPILDYDKLANAISDNDDYFYKGLVEDLQQIIYDAHNTVSDNNDTEIDNTIYGIKQNNDTDKFLDWIECYIPGFFKAKNIKDITYSYNQANLEHTQLFSVDDITSQGGSTTLSGGDNTVSDTLPKTKKKTPPKNKHGFSNFKNIILIILLAFAVGITIAMMLLNLKR